LGRGLNEGRIMSARGSSNLFGTLTGDCHSRRETTTIEVWGALSRNRRGTTQRFKERITAMNEIFRQMLNKISTRLHGSRFGIGMPARRPSALAICFILVGTAAGLALGQASHAHTTLPPVIAAASISQEPADPELGPAFPLAVTAKQRQAILKSNFEKIKKDAGELAAMAKSLQEEVDKSNENVLSLKIVEKAEKIENLAKKIKNTAKLG
jgi:hypothetical protein